MNGLKIQRPCVCIGFTFGLPGSPFIENLAVMYDRLAQITLYLLDIDLALCTLIGVDEKNRTLLYSVICYVQYSQLLF